MYANEPKIIEDLFILFVELTNDKLLFHNYEGIITDTNYKFFEITGYTRNEIIGKKITDFLDDKSKNIFLQNLFNKNNQKTIHELSFIKKDKMKVFTSLSITPVYDSEMILKGKLVIITDITKLKETFEALEILKKELKSKSSKIEELNTAINVLIENNNKLKTNIENQMISNLNERIYPYLFNLKFGGLDKEQQILLESIETKLKEIIPSATRSLSTKQPSLTHAEHQILTFIKEGKSTKEIADLLSISERTVDTHRFHIRKKLGITKQGKSLKSYLLTIN